jgi:hypothetical protein
MISAFAKAAQVLGDAEYAATAERAAGFLLTTMRRSGVLMRRFRDGETAIEAQLEDYAFLIQGLIDLYEATFRADLLRNALQLTEEMIGRLADPEHGGFFDTPAGDPSILVRTKEFYDGAEPSGNAVAILNLLRLAQMTGGKRYAEIAGSALRFFGDRLRAAPEALAQMLVAVDFSLSKPLQIVIAGRRDDPDVGELLKEVHSRFIPRRVLLLSDNQDSHSTGDLFPFIGTMGPIGGKAAAYVCVDYSCQLPVTGRRDLARTLDEEERKKPDP